MNTEGPTECAILQASRKRLLLAAERLFSQAGYHGTTLKEIAQAAGCSRERITRYFGGKKGLIPALAVFRCAEAEVALLKFFDRPGSLTLQDEALETMIFLQGRYEVIRPALQTLLSQAMHDPSLASYTRRIMGHGEPWARLVGRVSLFRHKRGSRIVEDAAADELLHICFRRFFLEEVQIGFSPSTLGLDDEAENYARLVQEVW